MQVAKITVQEAAAIMGCCPQFIRVGLQQQRLNIGDAIKMSSVWTYNISPHLLAKRQGITTEQLNNKIKELRA